MAKRSISGVLLLDKSYGITSNKALQKVKYLYESAKSGHTGTLDPLATGILPICMGEATKFSSILLTANKTYEAVIKLGYQSTTGDAEGIIEKLTEVGTTKLTIQYCETILQQFVGETIQIPPMYSALKHRGKPLYFYARNGEVIEREPRTILIHEIQIKSLFQNELTITVSCGTGTYIRTLAEDIGRALGCGGAYLIKLCRSSLGFFDLSQARKLEELEEMDKGDRDYCLLPIDSILQDLPRVVLDKNETKNILQGRVLSEKPDLNDWAAQKSHDKSVRLYYRQLFLGLGEVTSEQTIKPKRLLSESHLINQNQLQLN
ncbi:tRNA pseudouridine synthase B [Nitrosomonas aestuarii]|uniref:tRNA pseudouridine synthase B n=1 Tax=Nitrosomonas aestuarii TaxID=52441 RepID=A0A1I4AAN2_9PROT|nr:tRNA pseudouridine(55) synthase TruB [Nitrosomonas aestuarii]SFK53458.1 tRNA pseudouridine synthase B [Nitrosomonas aestuarii]